MSPEALRQRTAGFLRALAAELRVDADFLEHVTSDGRNAYAVAYLRARADHWEREARR